MVSGNVFRGRTIARSSDLSFDERFYLFEKARELKRAFLDGKDVTEFKLKKNTGVYLCFFEASTRTKESFKNAANFLGASVQNLDIESSSVTKKESYYNTIKTLAGYNNNIFIVRSKMEGLCTWLQESLERFSENHGMEKPCFVNGGDGKHEHPTQEELDQFTFLEQQEWVSSSIHIALIGDLFHGRTVHSKVFGLKNFANVRVDLIAPDVMQMPQHYVDVMQDNGFEVRKFNSLDEYYENNDIATVQYFTRLQIERMGDEVKQREHNLREAVTFRRDHMNKVPEGTKLYHPQPFDKENPTIPLCVADTELNGYDTQSINGFFWRVVLLNALAGNIGEDFKGQAKEEPVFEENFIEKVNAGNSREDPKVGIRPLENGVVIDHVCKGETAEEIWKHLQLVLKIIELNDTGFCGVGVSADGKSKGFVVMPDKGRFGEKDMKRLAAVSPGCTLNVIQNKVVEEKYRLHMPPRIYGFNELACRNPMCVSRGEYYEGVVPEFHADKGQFTCKYCDTVHSFKQIWKAQQKIL